MVSMSLVINIQTEDPCRTLAAPGLSAQSPLADKARQIVVNLWDEASLNKESFENLISKDYSQLNVRLAHMQLKVLFLGQFYWCIAEKFFMLKSTLHQVTNCQNLAALSVPENSKPETKRRHSAQLKDPSLLCIDPWCILISIVH